MSLLNTSDRPFTGVSHFGLDLGVRYFIRFLCTGNTPEDLAIDCIAQDASKGLNPACCLLIDGATLYGGGERVGGRLALFAPAG